MAVRLRRTVTAVAAALALAATALPASGEAADPSTDADPAVSGGGEAADPDPGGQTATVQDGHLAADATTDGDGDADSVRPAGDATTDDATTDSEAGSVRLAALDEPLAVRQAVRDAAGFVPPVRFRGSGWGHGVGMSQYGAYAMALEGRTSEQILTHYYPGTAITTDERSSTRRIRVSILDGIASTTVEAVDGDVPWRACRPAEGETIGGRVSDCTDWFVQPQGSTLRACPFREGGSNGIRLVAPDDPAGCVGEPIRSTTSYQVARIVHDGTTIRTPSHGGTLRRYRHGYRDLHSRDGGVLNSVQDVPTVERYLRGLAEVPSSWGRLGPAALEAQAITGRTFAVGRLGIAVGCACDIRATPADQHYTGYEKEAGADGELWVAAVDATTDRVLTFEGALAQTFYSSSHGGRSENLQDSWAYGTDPVPYLVSVDDPWSLAASPDDPTQPLNPRASWAASVGNAAFAAYVSAGRATPLERVDRVRILSRTDGGTPREVEVTGRTAAGARETFVFTHRPGDPGANKPIAGASFRRYLEISEGGTGGRLYSSQIQAIGFDPFTDDDGSVHELAISWAAEAGIVQGVSPERFRPGGDVTRGQMASFLFRTFEVPAATSTGTFPDVPADDVHAPAIEALAAIGLAGGFEDGTFRPGDPVSRQQMASFLARALALSSEATGTFSDVRDANVHRPAIEALAAAGITEGCGDGLYCPADPVARGQLASFLRRAIVG